jgi:peptide/nickel transport system permease protein
MTAYLLRRALALLPVLAIMSIIVFVLIRFVPGDPIDVMYGSEGMDAARRAALSQSLGLDQPVPIQYGRWLLRAVQGDLGNSYRAGMPVGQIILERLPATLSLAGAAILVSLFIAIPLGILAAVRRNSWLDFSALGFAIFGISLPNFFAGLLLVLIFAVYLHWLPALGTGSWRHVILPAVTLGWALSGTTTRLTRSSMLEELSKDYVRTARGKGLKEQSVVLHHGLRNAMLPTVTMIGLQMGFLIGGIVAVEKVFAWPGIGSLLVDSIFARDYPVVQGVVLVVAVMVVVINLGVDMVYTVLDPKIRL